MDETEQFKQTIVSGLFQSLLDDRILDLGLEVHERLLLRSLPCDVCGTFCRTPFAGHAPPAPAVPVNGAPSSAGTSRANTPVPPSNASASSSSGGLAAAGKGKKKDFNQATIDGNGMAFYDCLNCGKSTASNRYASHLSQCLGLNRRTTGRAAATKPGLLSANGNGDTNGNGKKNGQKASNKRAGSPNVASPKPKKAKVVALSSGTQSPAPDVSAKPSMSLSLPPSSKLSHVSLPPPTPTDGVFATKKTPAKMPPGKRPPGKMPPGKSPAFQGPAVRNGGGGGDYIAVDGGLIDTDSDDD